MKYSPLFFLFIFARPVYSTPINIITTDSQKKERIIQIDDKELINNLSDLYNSIEISMAKKLESTKSQESLRLTAINVGLGISGELGIGPFQISASITQNLKFIRKNE